MNKKRENSDLENLKNANALIKCSNEMLDVYKNIEEHNPNRKCNVLIVFDDMISDMPSNKELNPIVTDFLSEV